MSNETECFHGVRLDSFTEASAHLREMASHEEVTRGDMLLVTANIRWILGDVMDTQDSADDPIPYELANLIADIQYYER